MAVALMYVVSEKPLMGLLLYLKQERPPADDWKKSESSREYKNNNKLREYQLEGVNWLLFNWYNMYVKCGGFHLKKKKAYSSSFVVI